MDRSKLSFAQAEGAVPLPRPLALKEISPELRALLWAIIHENMTRDKLENDYSHPVIRGDWKFFLRTFHITVEHKPIDEFNSDWATAVSKIKAIIYEGDYVTIFDFLQRVIRDRDLAVSADIAWALKQTRAAYTVVDKTIMPVSSAEEQAGLLNALNDLKNGTFDRARAHLSKAGELASTGKVAESVRESIQAVESVASLLDPGARNALGPALEALERHARINRSLRSGFDSIYNYSNTQEGVRHALLDKDSPEVDAIDAQFILVACAAFISYMIAKARAANLLKE